MLEYGPQALQTVHFVGHAYWPHLLLAMCFLLMHTNTQARIGKGHQQFICTPVCSCCKEISFQKVQYNLTS